MSDEIAVTHFEVVDDRGRVYSQYGCSVELSYQEGGRTLKAFIKRQFPIGQQSPVKRYRMTVSKERGTVTAFSDCEIWTNVPDDEEWIRVTDVGSLLNAISAVDPVGERGQEGSTRDKDSSSLTAAISWKVKPR